MSVENIVKNNEKENNCIDIYGTCKEIKFKNSFAK